VVASLFVTFHHFRSAFSWHLELKFFRIFSLSACI